MTHTQKLLAFSALAILLTAGFPAPVHAEDAPPPSSGEGSNDFRGPKGPEGGPDREKRGQEMLKKADKDGDGYLTKDRNARGP